MPANKYETSWSLKLQAKGTAQARAMAREVRSLDAALRALGESSANLDRVTRNISVARSAQTRVRAERVAANATAREQRRIRTEISDSEMVRRAVGRSRDRYDRLQARESTDRTRRQQRVEARAARDSIAVGQRSARQNALAFRMSQRSQERDILRRSRSESSAAQRVARLNAAAFRRNNQADTNRVLAGDRARQRAAQREVLGSRTGLAGTLSFLRANAALGIVGGIASASWRALGALVDMAETVGGIVGQLGAATLQMIAFREASLTTLRAMARDSSGNRLTGAAADAHAREQFRFARDFARETPLDIQQVIELQRQTSAAGFSGNMNRQVLQAAADVGAYNPNDPTAASRFLLGLSQLNNASTVRTQDLRQTALAAGMNENDLLREIARGAGMTQRQGETDAQYNRRIQQAQQGGRFTGAQGRDGVLAALARRSPTGQLGGYARSQGGTLVATLSNLRGAFADFISGTEDIENLPGILALKKELNEVVGVLTGAGPVATRLRLTFAGLVNEVSGFLGGLAGKRGIEGVVTQVLDTLDEAWPIVRDITQAFGSGVWQGLQEGFAPLLAEVRASRPDWREIAATAGVIGRSLGRIVAFDVKALAKVAGLLGEILPVAAQLSTMVIGITEEVERDRGIIEEVGRNIVEGIRAGFAGESTAFLNDVRAWSQEIANTSRAELRIFSPSQVFRDIGAQIPAGMALGIREGAPGVDNAVRGLGAPGQVSRGIGGTFGTGNITVHAEFNINVGMGDLGDAAGNVVELGRSLGENAWSSIVERIEAIHRGGG